MSRLLHRFFFVCLTAAVILSCFSLQGYSPSHISCSGADDLYAGKEYPGSQERLCPAKAATPLTAGSSFTPWPGPTSEKAPALSGLCRLLAVPVAEPALRPIYLANLNIRR